MNKKSFRLFNASNAGEQAVDQIGHWPPQTGACSWQVGYKKIKQKKLL